jgi:putative Mn2+ efflux pump MntP
MRVWTELASILVLGVGANSENLPIGMAYGLRGLRIGQGPNLLIAGMTTAATILPLIVGRSLRGYMPVALPDLLAGSLLVVLGLANFWWDRRKRGRPLLIPGRSVGRVTSIGWKEGLTLAAALSVNNIGLGLAGGIAGLDYIPVILSVAGFSVLLLWLGQWLSRTVALPLTARFGWVGVDSNLLIIAVGIIVMAGL